jgi:hypothetical protein
VLNDAIKPAVRRCATTAAPTASSATQHNFRVYDREGRKRCPTRGYRAPIRRTCRSALDVLFAVPGVP